ncbi:hypothetical protein DIZ47_04860 [Legionella taurinensis]|uniref:Uncharacterized protein n=1 Tax=Legionella taurinensis TaxID=70611 RepID=A0A3A5L415_9GAMM|nr:hypothetical protein D6J04_08115 [Legionella taurinensis]RJT66819.1 hypothetical protein D6J03_08985 [Legionella taurinensis]TID52942.1 hypothetical protein DIZ64_04465 [Legionella taurinensis]TID54245.1 hypothetical protein DIZ47_04860 [Legionella taurinensis]
MQKFLLTGVELEGYTVCQKVNSRARQSKIKHLILWEKIIIVSLRFSLQARSSRVENAGFF